MNDIGRVSEKTTTHFGHRNVVWGWSTMILGGVTGSVLAFWSFAGPIDPPPGFTDYADLHRRMIRLAHIALFALPLINIVMGRDIDRAILSPKWKNVASWGAIIGMIGLPADLALSVFVDLRIKYLAAIPVDSLILAICLVAVGVKRIPRPE